jgi:hypothetical protein
MRVRKLFQLLVVGGAALATAAGTCSTASGPTSIGASKADGGMGQGGHDAGVEKGGGTQGW